MAGLDSLDLFDEPAGQGEEVVGSGVRGDAAAEASDGVCRQGRREVEPAGFLFEDGVHVSQEGAVGLPFTVGSYPSSPVGARPRAREEA